MTKSDWAYLAGIIDGEGTITILRHRQHKRTTYQLRPRLIVSNTCLDLMTHLKDKFGGKVVINSIRDGNRRSYFWRVIGQSEIAKIINEVLPYLLIKRRQATLMAEFVAERKKASKENKRSPYGPVEIRSYEQTKLINFRNKSVSKVQCIR